MIKEKITELILDEEYSELGVEIISLVDKPAIGVEWVALSEQDIHMQIVKLAEENGEEYDPDKIIYVDITNEKFSTLKDFVKGVIATNILGRWGIKKDQEPQLRFKYTGPAPQRNFCKAMMNMNKIYTKQEIDKMSLKIDTGFRHQNQPYSLFDFKGGVNCKHYWEQLSVFRNEDGTMVFISHGRAEGNAGQAAGPNNNFWRYPFSIVESEEDKRIVVGPVMIPNLPIKRVDENGEIFYVYFSEQTVKTASERFFKNLKINNTDVQHSEIITNKNILLESWIIEDKDNDKSKIWDFDLPVGTWMAKYKINDEETWNKIKTNELNGFSIDGNFKKN